MAQFAEETRRVTYHIILDPVHARVNLGIGLVGEIMPDRDRLHHSNLLKRPLGQLLCKIPVRDGNLVALWRRRRHGKELVRKHFRTSRNRDPRIIPSLQRRDILHLCTSRPRIIRRTILLLRIIGVRSPAAAENRKQERAVSNGVACAPEGNQLARDAGKVVLRVFGLGRAGNEDDIVLLRAGHRVIVEVVDGSVVARRKVNIELGGEIADGVGCARGRCEEQNVAILVDEFDNVLRRQSIAITYQS